MVEQRTARPDEYCRIMRFLENAYGHTRDFWCHCYPVVSLPERFDFTRTHLLVEDGEIRALVRVFPLELLLGGARVRVGGIGAVAADPETRGRGYMSRLMGAATAAMREEGFPLAALGGDRQRYRVFGYEHGGRQAVFTVTGRALARAGVGPVPPRRFHAGEAGSAATLAAVAGAYEQHPYRRRRPREDYPLLFEHTRRLLFHAGEGDGFGYLVLAGERGREGVVEFGGRAGTVLALAAACLERYRLPALDFAFPDRALAPAAYPAAAATWRLVPAWMISVLDPGATLAAFAGQAGAGAPPAAADLARLSPPEQVETLFGTLNRAAPFNFFIWPLDSI